MADGSTVKVNYLGDVSALARASRQARGEIDKVGASAEKQRGRMGKAFGGMGASAKAGIAGLVGGSLAAGGMAVFDMAAQMELMDAKAKTVFGGQIGTVEKWAKKNAAGMGMTKKEAVGLSAGFADLLIPMGFTREAAAKMSTETVGLSGALSQWSGGTVSAAGASDILAKAMLGERDGLKSLGIAISEEDVKNRLLKNGKDKLTGASLEQAKAEATQQLIFEKSTDAQTAYAKNTNGLAAQKAKLTAKVKELRDGAISRLIPLLVRLGAFINSNVVPPIKRLIDGFRNGEGAGGRLREGLAKLKAKFDENRPAIERVAGALGQVARFIVTKVIPVLFSLYATYLSKLIDVVKLVGSAFRGMVGIVLGVLGAVVNGAAKAFGWVPGLGGKLKKAAKEFNEFKDKVNASLDGINDKKVKVTAEVFYAPKGRGGNADIKGFARGTRSAPAGLALVGEEGPELVEMQGGERISTAARTRSLLRGSSGGGGGITVNNHLYVTGVIDDAMVRKLETMLARVARTEGRKLAFQ